MSNSPLPKKEPSAAKSEKELIESLQSLKNTLENIASSYDYTFHPIKSLFFTFLKGIAYGLGLLALAVLVVPITLALLKSVEWIPRVGKLINRIETEIQQTRQTSIRQQSTSGSLKD